MKLSVVMPCYNEEKRIESALYFLEKQSVKPEVIIVDGGSKDRTVGIIKEHMKKHKNIKLLKEAGKFRSPGNARNIGMKAATGEAIYLMDVDGRFEEDFVKKIVKGFEEHPKALLIRFICDPYPPEEFKSVVEKAMFYRDERGDGRLIIPTRRVIEKGYYYDPSVGFGEDRIWAQKLFLTEPITDVGIRVKQSKPASLGIRGLARKYMWYGRSMPFYLKKSKDSRSGLGLCFSFLTFVSFIFFWLYPITYLALFCLLVSMARGLMIGVKILRRFNMLSPLFVYLFTEPYSIFFIGAGFIRYLLGNRTVGR